MTKKKELVSVAPPQVPQDNSMALITKAIVEKADINTIEKLIQLKRDEEKDQARKAYHVAMAEFKANPPEIKKDRKVGYKTSAGSVGYSHASLYNVTKTINAELAKYGLSASWTTQQNGQIIVTCKITHILGHSEETSLSAPADASGSKNAIQAIGSTITYLERYTLLALTGLATQDQDDDARSVGAEYISDAEKNQLLDMLLTKDIKESKFLEYMKVESIDKIEKKDFKKAKLALEGAQKK